MIAKTVEGNVCLFSLAHKSRVKSGEVGCAVVKVFLGGSQMSPAFFPPSQTTAWAIFSQDTRAAVLVLWPHPGPMWPGLTVGMGEGLAWQSWALVGGRDSSSRPIPPSPCVKLHSGSQNTSRRGTETWGRRWCRRRKDGGGHC